MKGTFEETMARLKRVEAIKKGELKFNVDMWREIRENALQCRPLRQIEEEVLIKKFNKIWSDMENHQKLLDNLFNKYAKI